MSLEHLRNVKTGEIRPVETNSDEYVELINEVYDHDGSARPKWEITGRHHTSRLDADEVAEEDFGYENKPIPGSRATLADLRPEPHPERALTEAEVEAGVGSWEEKAKSLGFHTDDSDDGVEKLERVPVEERAERGRQMAGSEGNGKQRSRSSKSSSKSSGGTSGGGTTSGSSSGSGSGSGSGGSGS